MAGGSVVVAWSEPYELDRVRALADPLGIRAAANRVASGLLAPVTGGTDRVRHLGLFLVAANWASWGTSGGEIDRERYVVGARAITLALNQSAVIQLGGEVAALSRGLPGSRKAKVRVAHANPANLKHLQVLLDSPLLDDELSGGLWGRYARFAHQLGLLEQSGGRWSITKTGKEFALRSADIGFKGINSAPNAQRFADVLLAVAKRHAQMAHWTGVKKRAWPTLPLESQSFLSSIERLPAGSRRVRRLLALAAQSQNAKIWLRKLTRDPEAAQLTGNDGTPVHVLARHALALTDALEQVDAPFRARMLGDHEAGDTKPTAIDADLLRWAASRGLAIGDLQARELSWKAIEGHHERLFRSRGQNPWTTLDEIGRLYEIDPTPLALDFRFTAARRLGRDVRKEANW